jgi:uncharacterized membrane protein YbhN (UPF0104 family)
MAARVEPVPAADPAIPGSPAPSGARAPLWRRLLPVVGIGLLVWILSGLDGSALAASFSGLPWVVLAAAAGAFASNLAVKAFRWHRMLRGQGMALPLAASGPAYLSGLFYGLVTFGRLGEVMRVDVLVARGAPMGRALSSVLFERGLDVLVLMVVGGGLGAAVLADPRWGGLAAGAVVVGFVGGAAILRHGLTSGSENRTGWFPSRILRTALGRRLLGGGRDLLSGLRELLRASVVAETLAWTALAWTLYFSCIAIVAAGLGVPVGATLFAAASLAALTTLLPITYQGLGTRELVFPAVLGLAGVAFEDAVALSLIHFGVMFACSAGLGLLGLAKHRARQG